MKPWDDLMRLLGVLLPAWGVVILLAAALDHMFLR